MFLADRLGVTIGFKANAALSFDPIRPIQPLSFSTGKTVVLDPRNESDLHTTRNQARPSSSKRPRTDVSKRWVELTTQRFGFAVTIWGRIRSVNHSKSQIAVPPGRTSLTAKFGGFQSNLHLKCFGSPVHPSGGGCHRTLLKFTQDGALLCDRKNRRAGALASEPGT